jgi:hypothetical protein
VRTAVALPRLKVLNISKTEAADLTARTLAEYLKEDPPLEVRGGGGGAYALCLVCLFLFLFYAHASFRFI